MVNCSHKYLYMFHRDVDSESDDDYDDIYEGLSFGRKKAVQTVEVRIKALTRKIQWF